MTVFKHYNLTKYGIELSVTPIVDHIQKSSQISGHNQATLQFRQLTVQRRNTKKIKTGSRKKAGDMHTLRKLDVG